MAKMSFPTIPSDALIDIKISGTFYRKLLGLSVMLAESKPLEEYKSILEKLKSNNPPENLYESNVHTVISLIYEIETCARDQKKTKMVEVDTDNPESFKEA